jgi:aarF domain-containing kinase
VEGKYPKLKLHILDCGLALEMGPEQHVNIVKVLGAFTRRDGTLAGQLMVDMKSESQANEEQRKLFIEGIEQICIMDEDQNFIECVGDYIADICSMACKHRVKLEAAFVNAALAVEIMEGLASALYPDLKVQQIALPLIVKAEMMVRVSFGFNAVSQPRVIYLFLNRGAFLVFFSSVASVRLVLSEN